MSHMVISVYGVINVLPHGGVLNVLMSGPCY